MKKVVAVLKIMIEKKVIASILALIAITIPVTSKWLGVNAGELTNSITGLLVALSVILAMFGEVPFKKKDEENKGGKE